MEKKRTPSTSSKVLAKNLDSLMASHPGLDSNPKLAKKAKISVATLSRLRNHEVEATLESVERLAKAFDTHPWQLLVPEMDPKNLPALQPVSEAERKLHERLRQLAQELKEVP